MRVGLLTHAARAGDAIGRQLAAKVAYFRDRAADVRVIAASDANPAPGLSPCLHRLPPPQARGPLVAWLCACDLIVVEYSQDSPVLELLPLVAGGKPRIVFDYHGVTPPALGGASHRDALVRGEENKGLVWFADAAIAHSRFTRDDLRSATGYPTERTHALGYPLDLANFTPGEPCTDLRSRLALNSQTRVLLFVGRLAPNKRAPILVEALAHLSEEVHAVFVGDCGDCFEAERQRCREQAARHRVADRVHFLGAVDEAELLDAYRSADLLVMPSVHEGFCLPAIEAMACGLPVVAARAAALPETLGDAGLTFEAEDARDLARVASRVLHSRAAESARNVNKMRVALVSARFGDGFVGGAESSLRLLANRMRLAGHTVEVFALSDGFTFRADSSNPDRHAAAADEIQRAKGSVPPHVETAFLANSPRSAQLVAALRERGPFDAIVVGPYSSGLAVDVAEQFPERTVLVPCWHDEPTSRLLAFRAAYRAIGGVLYHSAEEQGFAETTLGLNHPNSRVVGTLIEPRAGDAARGRALIGSGRRYLLYAGRYCREKGLPDLLVYAERYAAAHPTRFTFAFMGSGDALIPTTTWACDLGYLTDEARADVMAGADALVLLSPNESLSLAVLEAHSLGVPAIVRAGNAVLETHLTCGNGGIAVDSYEAFAAALDDLWADPAHWRDLGRNGREYVERRFADPAAFDRQWQAALDRVDTPLRDQLQANGLRRAATFEMGAWREAFGQIIDAVLDSPRRTGECRIDIRPCDTAITVSAGQDETLVPVRLSVNGAFPALADGPGRTELVSQVVNAEGRRAGVAVVTPLPGMLLPGRTVSAVVRIAVPEMDGDYAIQIATRRAAGITPSAHSAEIALCVSTANAEEFGAPLIPARFRDVLLAADSARQLPDGYVDVTLGRFARIKRWVKQKLLHNFQHAYVDVLSRQQSAFNRQAVNALAELADAQAMLDHAIRQRNDVSALRSEIRALRKRQRRLARDLSRLRNAQESHA